jgi:hypothetical protein
VRRLLVLALAAASLLVATPAAASRSQDKVTVCHGTGNGGYVEITVAAAAVEAGHGDHLDAGRDYIDHNGFGCPSDPTAELPEDPGKDCFGATVPSDFVCEEAPASTTTSTTIPETTTTTTSAPATSTPTTTTGSTEASSPSSSSPPVELAPSQQLSQPTPMTELPRTGAALDLLIYLGICFLVGGILFLAASR